MQINYGFSDDVCNDLKNHTREEDLVNNLVSNTLMWRSILETAIKVIWVLCLGSWSDRWGRKIPLFISISGLLGEAAIYLALYFLSSWSVETTLIASLSYGLSGGTHALLMICFSSIADVSSTNRRTLRVSLLDGAYYLGSPVGMAILSPLRSWGGYLAVYTVVISVYLITLLYVGLMFKERRDISSRPPNNTCGNCGLNDLTDAVKATCRHRPDGSTVLIFLLILAMLFDSLPVWGAGNVKYLFTQKALDWTYKEYSTWSTVCSLLTVFGALVLVPLLTHLLKVSDVTIGVIGAASRCASNLTYGIITKPSQAWIIYTGAAMGTGAPMCPIGIRSMLSKLAGKEDIGKVYAVMAMCECFLPFIAAPIYNTIFTSSPHLPGSYNFFSAFMNMFIIVCFVIVRILQHTETISTDT